jgi:hypothetical protein
VVLFVPLADCVVAAFGGRLHLVADIGAERPVLG